MIERQGTNYPHQRGYGHYASFDFILAAEKLAGSIGEGLDLPNQQLEFLNLIAKSQGHESFKAMSGHRAFRAFDLEDKDFWHSESLVQAEYHQKFGDGLVLNTVCYVDRSTMRVYPSTAIRSRRWSEERWVVLDGDRHHYIHAKEDRTFAFALSSYEDYVQAIRNRLELVQQSTLFEFDSHPTFMGINPDWYVELQELFSFIGFGTFKGDDGEDLSYPELDDCLSEIEVWYAESQNEEYDIFEMRLSALDWLFSTLTDEKTIHCPQQDIKIVCTGPDLSRTR